MQVSTIKEQKIGELDIKTLRAYRIFRIESKRLLNLYNASCFAYLFTRSEIYKKIKTGDLKFEEDFSFLSDGNTYSIPKAAQYNHRMKGQYPRYLRELLFVRLISTLETFLKDSINEVFLADRSVFHFHQNENFEVNKTELLSFSRIEDIHKKFIEKESRGLQGYEEIKKFYFKRFNIDFGSSGINLAKISKYHDERHLLVHRLGKTDKQYKHHYSVNSKQISIEETYLIEAINLINDFCYFINSKLLKLLEI